MMREVKQLIFLLVLFALVGFGIIGANEMGWIPKEQDIPHPPGVLKVLVNPKGSEIFLNGSPLEHDETELPAGEYQIDVIQPGYNAKTIHVSMEEGKTTVITATLVKRSNHKYLGFVAAGVLVFFTFVPVFAIYNLERKL